MPNTPITPVATAPQDRLSLSVADVRIGDQAESAGVTCSCCCCSCAVLED